MSRQFQWYYFLYRIYETTCRKLFTLQSKAVYYFGLRIDKLVLFQYNVL